jgi:hypothetical protein
MSLFHLDQYGENTGPSKYTPNLLAQVKEWSTTARVTAGPGTVRRQNDVGSLLATPSWKTGRLPSARYRAQNIIGVPNDEHVYMVNYHQLPHILWDCSWET